MEEVQYNGNEIHVDPWRWKSRTEKCRSGRLEIGWQKSSAVNYKACLLTSDSLIRKVAASVGRPKENVVIELLKAKCLPSLYYGLEACPINKSQIKSLDSVLNSAFRKLFVIKSYDVANECIVFLNCSVSDAIHERKIKFLTKLQHSENTICKLLSLIHIWRCRRSTLCRSRWSPYH